MVRSATGAPAAETRAVRLYVSLPLAARSQLKGEATAIEIEVEDTETGKESTRATTFKGPA